VLTGDSWVLDIEISLPDMKTCLLFYFKFWYCHTVEVRM